MYVSSCTHNTCVHFLVRTHILTRKCTYIKQYQASIKPPDVCLCDHHFVPVAGAACLSILVLKWQYNFHIREHFNYSLQAIDPSMTFALSVCNPTIRHSLLSLLLTQLEVTLVKPNMQQHAYTGQFCCCNWNFVEFGTGAVCSNQCTCVCIQIHTQCRCM